MRYFVTSDDAALAQQISLLLVQLRRNLPASNVMRLEAVVPALESATADEPTASGPGVRGSKDVVLVVFSPDPERAVAVVREIHRKSAARILAVGPTTDTKLVLRAMREGAAEYLDQGELQTELSEALQRMDSSGTSGRIVALLAPCGGSGASTLAVNVATVLAQKHSRSLLMDLRLETGDLAPLLNLKPNHTLADLCQNIERLDHSLLQGCLAPCESGVQLLAAPARIADVARITPRAIDLVLSLACRHFPWIVLDLDHTFRPEQRLAMQRADVIGLVLRLDFLSLRNARTTLDYFQEIGVSRDKVRVIANRLGEPGQLTAAQIDESLGMKVSQFIPDDAKTVNRANNSGVPVVLHSPSSRVSRSLADLATSLAAPPPSSA